MSLPQVTCSYPLGYPNGLTLDKSQPPSHALRTREKNSSSGEVSAEQPEGSAVYLADLVPWVIWLMSSIKEKQGKDLFRC